MHGTIQANFIGTQESVYRDSPAGKLEKTSLVRTMLVPLQQGFDSDSQACLSVSIDNLSAFTLEHGIVSTMPLPNSTAVGTPFARMPAIHDVQMNMIVKTSLLKNLLELEERNTHDNSVEILAFGTKSFKFFNGNISIIPDGEADDFSDHLAEVGLDEIPLSAFCLDQFLSGIVGLENSFAFHKLLVFCPDVPSEIGLVKDSALWRNNAGCEMLGVDINAKRTFFLCWISDSLDK